jgi:hypothetical protein
LAKFWGIQHRCRYKWITDSKAAISKVTLIAKSQNTARRYPDDVDYITAIKELNRSIGAGNYTRLGLKDTRMGL